MKIQSQILLMGATSSFVWGGVNVTPSYAINLIGNLPSNDSTATAIFNTSSKSVSFTLPSGNSYSLDNVVLRLDSNYDTGDVSLLTIRNNGSGTAGSTILANFTSPTPLATTAYYNFNPTSSFVFQPSTTYWLSLTSSAGNFSWRSSNPRVTPSGIVTFGQYQLNNTGTSTIYNSFQINATVVPWETDALPVVGSTAIFGLGVWAKSKLAQKKIDKLYKVVTTFCFVSAQV
jgi:hypothetical protein